MSDGIGRANAGKICGTVGVEWCKCVCLSVCDSEAEDLCDKVGLIAGSVCDLLQVWCWCGGYCNCGPFEWTRAGLHLHLPQTTEATQVRLQSFLSSSHPLYVLYSHVPITQAIYMYIYRQLRMPQLPYSCVLAMQVAASEETVPGCDEYSGCPCATAAKVRGMGGEEE